MWQTTSGHLNFVLILESMTCTSHWEFLHVVNQLCSSSSDFETILFVSVKVLSSMMKRKYLTCILLAIYNLQTPLSGCEAIHGRFFHPVSINQRRISFTCFTRPVCVLVFRIARCGFLLTITSRVVPTTCVSRVTLSVC